MSGATVGFMLAEIARVCDYGVTFCGNASVAAFLFAENMLLSMPGRLSTWSFYQLGRLSTRYKGELFKGLTVKCTMCSLFHLTFRLFLYLYQLICININKNTPPELKLVMV